MRPVPSKTKCESAAPEFGEYEVFPPCAGVRSRTVAPSRTPRMIDAVGDAPARTQCILTKTLPLAGAVIVWRRFVVSIAVIASVEVVAALPAVDGSYAFPARRFDVSQISKLKPPFELFEVVSFG